MENGDTKEVWYLNFGFCCWKAVFLINLFLLGKEEQVWVSVIVSQ